MTPKFNELYPVHNKGQFALSSGVTGQDFLIKISLQLNISQDHRGLTLGPGKDSGLSSSSAMGACPGGIAQQAELAWYCKAGVSRVQGLPSQAPSRLFCKSRLIKYIETLLPHCVK